MKTTLTEEQQKAMFNEWYKAMLRMLPKDLKVRTEDINTMINTYAEAHHDANAQEDGGSSVVVNPRAITIKDGMTEDRIKELVAQHIATIPNSLKENSIVYKWNETRPAILGTNVSLNQEKDIGGSKAYGISYASKKDWLFVMDSESHTLRILKGSDLSIVMAIDTNTFGVDTTQYHVATTPDAKRVAISQVKTGFIRVLKLKDNLTGYELESSIDISGEYNLGDLALDGIGSTLVFGTYNNKEIKIYDLNEQGSWNHNKTYNIGLGCRGVEISKDGLEIYATTTDGSIRGITKVDGVWGNIENIVVLPDGYGSDSHKYLAISLDKQVLYVGDSSYSNNQGRVNVFYRSFEEGLSMDVVPTLTSANSSGFIVTDGGHYQNSEGWKAFNADETGGFYNTGNNSSLSIEYPYQCKLRSIETKHSSRNIKVGIYGVTNDGTEVLLKQTDLLPKTTDTHNLVDITSEVEFKKFKFIFWTDSGAGDPSIHDIKMNVLKESNTATWQHKYDIYPTNPTDSNQYGAGVALNDDNSVAFISEYMSHKVYKYDITVSNAVLDANSLDPFDDGSLKHFYKLDGDAVDSVGGADLSSSEGIVTYKDAKFGKAIDLDGRGNVYSNNMNTTLFKDKTPTSLSFWYKDNGSTNNDIHYILSKRSSGSSDGAQIDLVYILSTKKLSFSYYSANGRVNLGFTIVFDFTDNLHLISFSMGSDGIVHLYIDGVLRESKGANWSGISNVPQNYLALGSVITDTNAGYFPRGIIDHLQIFDRALTQEEVTKLYKAEVK